MSIGARISVGGHLGTVAFVGEVPPKGEWLGVVWDDAARGKHDGSHEGVRYFDAGGATAGSFVRPKKVDAGLELMQALRERYGTAIEEGGGTTTLLDARRQAIRVELVGAEKAFAEQNDVSRLVSVSLAGMPVVLGDPPGEVAAGAPQVCTLDLSRTPVPGYAAVAAAASELPRLECLRLCGTRVPQPPPGAWPASAFGALRELHLNETAVSVPAAEALCKGTPALAELHLCGNGYAALEGAGGPGAPLQLPPTLVLLDLKDNALDSWDAVVAAVGGLPALAMLGLAMNRLEGLSPVPGDRLTALTALDLSTNRLATWASVEALGTMSALADLRLRRNPLVEADGALAARQLVVARLPALRTLNKSAVGEQERIIAERFYLTHHAREFWAAHDQDVECAVPHVPRLVGIHGEPDRPAAIQSLKAGFVGLTVRGAKPVLKLPGSTKVGRLRQVLKAKRLLPPAAGAKPELWYHATGGDGGAILLEDDLRELQFYEVQQGELEVRPCL